MFKEFPNRIHGDGRLIIDESFYSPVSRKETPQYIRTLTDIMSRAKITMPLNPQDPQLASTLLALKQRFMIAFSGGCPWPEKAVSEYLLAQKTQPATLVELTTQIRESARSDGKHSFLFQSLLQNASKPLRDELLNYHPWQPLEKQENRHLPHNITDSDGKGAYGLAYDPPYFDVLIPLYKYIDDNKNKGTHEARYFAVTDFLEKAASGAQSIEDLIGQTKGFLTNPQAYLEQYL